MAVRKVLKKAWKKVWRKALKKVVRALQGVLDPVAIAERFKMSLEQVMDILGQKQIFLAAHIPDLRI